MGRKKKTLHDYAAEFTDLAVKRHLIEHKDSGETSVVETLYCKSCELPMRVRRDRILEHLASGRHYRNRRLIKQHGTRTPLLLSTGADLGSSLPMGLDTSLVPQTSFILPSNPCSSSISTSARGNVVPSPPSYHHPPLLPVHRNTISSTTSVISGREDATPSTSSTHQSSFGAIHIRNPPMSSKHTNQRHVISEASNSVVPGGIYTSSNTRGNQIGLAIIGVSYASKALLRSLNEENGCCLYYIVEDQRSEVEGVFSSEILSKTRVLQEQDVDIVLNDRRVSGVIICSLPEVAAVMTLETLRAGKAVLCEKLLSTSRQTVEACFDEADRYGKPLVCGFYKRFDPAFKFLHEKVRENKSLGRIQKISTVSRIYPSVPLNNLKMSGGLYYNTAMFDIDIVTWLLGERIPDTVFSLGHAFCSDMSAMKEADTATICMKFASGAVVSLDISQHCTKSCDQRLEVHGSQGTLRIDNQNPLGITENGTSVPLCSQTHEERYREAYAELFRHFLRTIKGKEQPKVIKEQYIWALQVAAAAEQSWHSGSAVDLRNEVVDVSIIKTEIV
ncbi:myo-inositol 2-dehydrogenase [Xenopus laevis]|uniref:Gfo/Idh/MocA-like oxidoreductase N-terminal domain-containing protein n=2 Tax=Xenopus laevis TaxID=8355 RepID=A0A974HCG6_XENLA|nr:myo-inositol 2-dehydrogenase [Xenopus laevis]OCT72827.1 hypothetical protein XELAEV_18035808mg [Xenopus laevis]